MSAYESASHFRLGTSLIHVGSEPSPSTGAVVPPISLATTFVQTSPGVHPGVSDPNSFGRGYDYSRTCNPTRGGFERALGSIEHGQCVSFSSGCAAISACLHLLPPGSNLLCISDVYGGTHRLLTKIASTNLNINITFTDFDVLTSEAVKDVQMIWLETPTNPSLKITSIKKMVELAPENCLLCVDNTFASPYFQNPLLLGADVVVHSVTKYINGHSDVVMGAAITGKEDIYEKLRFHQNAVGAVPSPFDCYLALRGLKTLHVRMDLCEKNAHAIALFLEKKGLKVIYPGLENHPQHIIAKEQMKGFGGMISFYVDGGIEDTSKFLSKLKVFLLAESLGAVESLAECPAIMTHSGIPKEERVKVGVEDNLVRLSVGLEGIDDLCADLEQALQK
ncbi:hypothetical protein TL16_g12487 [Triparma laevis f. inornata]|uniref:cystathionine gamma-lyase n=2 Tax=Triparma laevis TaxID=1534972 RepID=A0A9W7FQS5_9STRA|nr:hypothetical protein TL16_g12487 [Triparma laevis f. inornata]GMI16316.1 hypothetical protein TrLO_g11833 [Triparma laevis f. longispina]